MGEGERKSKEEKKEERKGEEGREGGRGRGGGGEMERKEGSGKISISHNE